MKTEAIYQDCLFSSSILKRILNARIFKGYSNLDLIRFIVSSLHNKHFTVFLRFTLTTSVVFCF